MRYHILRSFCILASVFSLGVLHAETTLPAAPDEFRYTVEDLQGDATLIKADGSDEVLQEGSSIGPGEQVQIGKDAQAVLMLDDETSVQLGSGTFLKVDQLQTNPQKGFFSRLKLLGGRVLAQVQKLAATQSRFEIESGGVVCGVRGTAFEVETQGEDVETRTHEGEVSVSSNGKAESLKAGRVFAFRKGLLRMRRRLDRIEMDRFSKWKGARLLIREKRLKRMKESKRRHRIEIRPLRRRPKTTSWVPS